MKRPQWIVITSAFLLTAIIYLFGRTVPVKNTGINSASTVDSAGENHSFVTIDTILALAKKQLSPDQVMRVNTLENTITRGALKEQQLHVYHQLASFWADSARVFEPYAWYGAEAARLENSEKSLTFAAHLFLANLQFDEVAARRRWKALQAKDLFERSLKINPGNDSAKVGLGSTYLFADISTTPMEGILMIREVADRDSTNIYAQMMLSKGSVISGQYEKSIGRLQTVNRLEPENVEAILLLAEIYERLKDNENAITWYRKSLPLIKLPEIRKEIEKRVEDLKK